MQYKNPDVYSSYRENDLGRTFYDLVLTHKPKKIVEFGVLFGYSTIAMAMALDELKEGHIWANDLFEAYPYRHSSMEETQKNIDAYGVSKYVTLQRNDFEEWLKNSEPFDMLHVDISNKGDTIQRLYTAVEKQVTNGAVVVFEGGTAERDKVEWMVKYNCKKITESGVPYKVINPAFTSLSMLVPRT